MIRPQVLETFAEALAPGGFKAEALMPSYGMAEVSLAVSFTAPGTGLKTDRIDRLAREREGIAKPAEGPDSLRFTCCGEALPGYEIEIRDPAGSPAPMAYWAASSSAARAPWRGTSRKRGSTGVPCTGLG